MARAFLIIVATINSLALTARAQSDTTRSPFHWGIEAAHLYQHTFNNYQIFTADRAYRWSPSIATDNPIIHGASYAKLLGSFEPIHGMTLVGELVAEHRGISYGIYPQFAMEVFPRITFGIDTAISIGSEKLKIGFKLGHFNELRLQEGLTIFNMDVQGSDAFIGYKRLKFRMNHIGDLEYSYGLNINDLHNYLLELDRVPIDESLSLTSSVMFETTGANPIEAAGLTPNVWSIASSVHFDSITAYSTVARRADTRFFTDNWATLFGLRARMSQPDWQLDGNVEYRYYSAGFNTRRFSGIRPFRSTGSSGFIYPLDRYERPFVAWAYFTEYQSSDIESVSGLLRGRFRLYKDLWVHGYGECIASRTEYEGRQLFPFYDLGLAWQPLDRSFVKLSLGNRSMNLDKHYPTLYALKIPALNIHFKVTY